MIRTHAEPGEDTAPPATAPAGERNGSVAGLASASYLGLALGLVTSPIVARVLGPTARGEYAAIYTFEIALVTVLALGLPAAILHRLVNRLERPEALLGTAVRFCAALVLPAFGCAIALTTGVLELPGGAATYLAIAALALAPTGVLAVCLQGFLTARGALGSLAWLRIAPLAVNFAGVIALTVLGALTLVSYLALTVGISLFSLVLAWRFLSMRPHGRTTIRPLLSFGLRSYPGSFARMLNFRVDQIILVPLVAPTQLAFYAIAVTISQLPQSLADAIGTRTMGSVIDRERRFLVDRSERYLRLNLASALIACAGLATLAPVVVPLAYGSAFAGVVAPLLLLLPGAVANAGTRVASSCLIAIGRPGINSLAETSSLLITAGGLWYALPRFGISGAAAVSSIAYLYRYLVQMTALRQAGVRKLWPRREDLAELIRIIPRPLPARAWR